jgi:hypothetical protein
MIIQDVRSITVYDHDEDFIQLSLWVSDPVNRCHWYFLDETKSFTAIMDNISWDNFVIDFNLEIGMFKEQNVQ